MWMELRVHYVESRDELENKINKINARLAWMARDGKHVGWDGRMADSSGKTSLRRLRSMLRI